MQITLDLDDKLVAAASELTGIKEPSALLSECLKTLIEQESTNKLAKFGGSEPQVEYIVRRRFG